MQTERFVATVNSNKPYYPMLLSNGNDSVLINYSGSMVSALTGHAHYEQHQCAPCAWYRISHVGNMKSTMSIRPIFQSGYQVIVDGEVCEPCDYNQQFDPKKAILKTVTESWGVKLEVETFMTERAIFVERFRVLKAPKKTEFALFIRPNEAGTSGLGAYQAADIKIDSIKQKTIEFSYNLDGIRGSGGMFCDRKGKLDDSRVKGLRFSNIKKGWTVTRLTVIADSTDGRDYKNKLNQAAQKIATTGYEGIKAAHLSDWKEYSSQNSISVSDSQMQYLYDLALYSLRANQHQDTGAVVCGMLPYHWGGGVVCPYDASYSQRAFLISNRVTRACRHIGFHLSRQSKAKRDANKLGITGAVYSGWTNYKGKHRGAQDDFERYVLQYKPLMSAFLVIDYFNQWKFAPNQKAGCKYIKAMREILDLAIENFIIEKGNKAVMRPCIAGNESDIEVQNDTFNSLMYARALKDYAQMACDLGVEGFEKYKELSEKMYRGLEANFRKDGVLLPWKNAKYLTGLQLQFYLWSLPEGISPEGIRAYLKEARTSWGLDGIQPSEQYRDWPWHGARAAIALAHMGDAKESFKQLSQFPQHASALGAIPEKIRIDGYPIGYWYSTPFAIFTWAMNDAFCHDGADDKIRLLWGLDGTWKNAKFKNIRLSGGILASGKIEKGRLVQLSLKNTSAENLCRHLEINPIYKPAKLPSVVELAAGKTIRVIKNNG